MKSPILFLIFNRPDTTKRVFEEIRKAQPPRLYIAADGPRPSRQGEKELCEQTRAIATNVDWDCEVKTLFREENLGCGKAVSQAITWFFDNEPEGIILEDDVLPHPDFFPYCDELLEKYRDNEEIGVIAGHNHFYKDFNRSTSYAFQNLPAIWGWASWKRVWNDYDFDLKCPLDDFKSRLKHIYPEKNIQNFWEWIFIKLRHNLIDTWDFQFAISLLLNGKINIVPYVNLTCNLGFGNDSTHTATDKNNESGITTQNILPIKHPSNILVDNEAEYRVIECASWKLNTCHFFFNKVKLAITRK